MTYGWSRPDVISRGPGSGDCSACADGAAHTSVDGFFHGDGEIIYDGEMFQDYSPGVQLNPPEEALEELPETQPDQLPEPKPGEQDNLQPAPQNPAPPAETLDPATTLRSPLRTPMLRTTDTSAPATAAAGVARIKWGTTESSSSKPTAPKAEATVRLVNHIE
jgi:hypothetical protein